MAGKRATPQEQIRRTLAWLQFSLQQMREALELGDHRLAVAHYSDLHRLAKQLSILLPYEHTRRIVLPAGVLASLLEALTDLEALLQRNARIANVSSFLLGQVIQVYTRGQWVSATVEDFEQSPTNPATLVYFVGGRWLGPEHLREKREVT